VPIVVVADHDLMRAMFHRDAETYAGRYLFNEAFERFKSEQQRVFRMEIYA
jgi:hypothetical protein